MASVIKYIARKFLFPFINYSGITTRISNQSENNLLILNYHGVIPEPDFSISPNHISTKDFDNELEYFSSKFNFINPEEFHSGNVSVKNNGKKNILLTFDDGYSNNFNYAFPILKKRSNPSAKPAGWAAASAHCFARSTARSRPCAISRFRWRPVSCSGSSGRMEPANLPP